MTCGRRFHAVPSCVKSCDTNVIAKRSINACQNCLDDSLPFQKLDDFDYEFTVLKGNNINDWDMDRLSRLKFKPFDTHSDIALTSNNKNLNYSTKINCEYYLPNDFSCLMKTANTANGDIFSITHLNIRSLSNKLNSLKQLLNSLSIPNTVGNTKYDIHM